jgi:hypothetical protein
MATHINTLIMGQLKNVIAEATDVAISEGGAGIVKAGRVMQSLVKEVTTIAIYPGDPQNPDQWYDEPGEWTYDGKSYSTEIGGGRPYLRRFTLEVRMFLQRLHLDQEQAYNIGFLLVDRIEQAIEGNSRAIATACRTDEEVLWGSQHAIKRSRVFQSGGEKAPILSIKFWLEFDTARNN